MEGADESTELWCPPPTNKIHFLARVFVIVLKITFSATIFAPGPDVINKFQCRVDTLS